AFGSGTRPVRVRRRHVRRVRGADRRPVSPGFRRVLLGPAVPSGAGRVGLAVAVGPGPGRLLRAGQHLRAVPDAGPEHVRPVPDARSEHVGAVPGTGPEHVRPLLDAWAEHAGSDAWGARSRGRPVLLQRGPAL